MTAVAPDIDLDIDYDADVPCEYADTDCPTPATWLLIVRHKDGSECRRGTLCDEHLAELVRDERAQVISGITRGRRNVCREHRVDWGWLDWRRL